MDGSLIARAAGSDQVQGNAAPDQLMVAVTPQVAADAVHKKQRAEKRPAADAMSPGHLASTAALLPVERRQQHAVLGVDRDFRENVKDSATALGLTRDVREVQHVMRQVITAIQDLQKNDFDQEARMVLAIQRVDGIDPKITQLEGVDERLKGQMKDMGDFYTDRMKEFVGEIGNKDKLLHAALATQEAVLNDRIQEIKELFVKCDEIPVKKG
jgi:hypothetical protein